jgi:hypothetical protein
MTSEICDSFTLSSLAGNRPDAPPRQDCGLLGQNACKHQSDATVTHFQRTADTPPLPRCKQSMGHLQGSPPSWCSRRGAVRPTGTSPLKIDNFRHAAALARRSVPRCSRLCVVRTFEEDGILASTRCTLIGTAVFSLVCGAHFR